MKSPTTILLLFVNLVSAQTFVDGTTYFYSGVSNQGLTNYYSGSLETIHLDSVSRNTEFYHFDKTKSKVEVKNDSIFYENNLIFISNLSQFDSFRIKCIRGIVDSFTIIIDSVDRNILNNNKLYHFSMIPAPWESYGNFTREEGLGSYEQGIYYPRVCGFFEGHGRLAAYCRNDTPRHPESQLWSRPGDTRCDFKESLRILSIDHISTNDAFTISPNPSNGIFKISNTQNQTPKEIEVFDMQGRKVNFSLSENKLSIDSPAGIYYLRIRRDDGLREVHKVIVE